MESISSMKIVDGAWCLASSKSMRTSFSESPSRWMSTRHDLSRSSLPLHLLMMDDTDTLKKVVLHSVATARASNVLPTPGGPTPHSEIFLE